MGDPGPTIAWLISLKKEVNQAMVEPLSCFLLLPRDLEIETAGPFSSLLAGILSAALVGEMVHP
jgi:hypothetical protein